MFLCFVLDTNPAMRSPAARAASSASPAAKLSALDAAKCGIEQVIFKFRSMGFSNIPDQNLLLLQSGAEPRGQGSILSSIHSTQQSFDRALKNITFSETSHSLLPTIDVAFQTLAKYRTKSGIDNRGKGLVPWMLEQAFIIILTNDISTLNSLQFQNGSGASSSYFMPLHKWDQKVVVYEIGRSESDRMTELSSLPSSPILKFCKASGGDVEECPDFETLLNKLVHLTTRLVETYHSSPQVSLSLVIPHQTLALSDVNRLQNSDKHKQSSEVTIALIVNKAGQWPFPECAWIDRSVDVLPPREPLHTLHVESLSSTSGLVSDEPNKRISYSTEQLQTMIGAAKANGLIVDSYEVKLLYGHDSSYPNQSSSTQSRLTIHAEPLESRNNGIAESLFHRKWVGLTVPKSNRHPAEPAPLCAVLASSTNNSQSTSELLVLPYNFPALIPLMAQARDLAVSQGGHIHSKPDGSVLLPSVLNPALSLPDKWQSQMKAYLVKVPPYYFHSLYKAFEPLGIHVFISLFTGAATASAPHRDNCISRVVSKALKSAYNTACADINMLEAQLLKQSQKVVVNVGLGHEVNCGGDEFDEFDTCSELSSFSTVSNSAGKKESKDFSLSPYIPTHIPCDIDDTLKSQSSSGVSNLEEKVDSSPRTANDAKNQKHSEQLLKYLKSLCLPLVEPRLTSSCANNDQSGEPSLLFPPQCQDLLYTWERMRSRLYGDKGGGVVVSGLYVAGRLNDTGGSVVKGGKDGRGGNGQKERDWFFKACGGATVPRLSIRDMGDFQRVLTRKEAVRDPELINPPADEDEPRGILRRKLDINFGSPYKHVLKMRTLDRKGKSNSSDSSALLGDNATAMTSDTLLDEGTDNVSLVLDSLPPPPASAKQKSVTSPNRKKRSFKEFQKIRHAERKERPIIKSSSINVTAEGSSSVESSEKKVKVSSTIESCESEAKRMRTDSSQTTSSSPSSPAVKPARQEQVQGQTQEKSTPPQLDKEAAAVSNLEEGWTERFSSKHKRQYWFNSLTGKSQWFPPTRPD